MEDTDRTENEGKIKNNEEDFDDDDNVDKKEIIDWLILMACQSIWVIFCLEVRESHSFCIHIYIFV